MAENPIGAHTVYNIQYHMVWVTKYRYKVLRGEACAGTDSADVHESGD
jgi:REP element-mobilizing transposase RayT